MYHLFHQFSQGSFECFKERSHLTQESRIISVNFRYSNQVFGGRENQAAVQEKVVQEWPIKALTATAPRISHL